MEGYTLSIEPDPKAEDLAVVRTGLTEYNRGRAGEENLRRLGVFLKDAAGTAVAGLVGNGYWGVLAIDWIWVREELRGQGHGSRLMAAAEEQARAWGLTQVHLDTFTFQAPDFYPKLGFEEFGRLDGFEGGHSRVYFRKRLR